MNAFWDRIGGNNRRQELVAILVLSIVGFLVAAGSLIAFLMASHRLWFLLPAAMGLAVGIGGLLKFARHRRLGAL